MFGVWLHKNGPGLNSVGNLRGLLDLSDSAGKTETGIQTEICNDNVTCFIDIFDQPTANEFVQCILDGAIANPVTCSPDDHQLSRG
jgi:hypothetical protein